MMYQTGLVAVIKVNGKVLRENKDVVLLPFGSEYSILIKNLKSQRVMVNVSIDGTDILDGQKLVINANSEVELERFIKNGNLNQGNRFKFIERTEAIEEYRGIKVDDGIVRIEYWAEVESLPVISRPYFTYDIDHVRYDHDMQIWNTALKGSVGPTRYRSFDSIDSLPTKSRGITGSSFNSVKYSANTLRSAESRGIEISASGFTNTSTSEEGITVPGSVSNQKFSTVSWFPTESKSEVIILKLRGKVEDRMVNKPILVKTKIVCPTCGRKNDINMQFCPICGTALHMV